MRPNRAYQASVVATCLAIGLYMTVSPALLTAIGVPYITTTGNFIFKLHPGTYALLAAVAFGLLSRGNPLTSAILSMRKHLPLVLHLCGILLLFGYSMLRYGPSGSAFLIETFMAPALIVLVLANFRASEQRFVYRFILGLLVVNSLIAIGETLLQQHLVPYIVSDGVAIEEEYFRATSLLGHPLNNAIITASLLFSTLDMRSRPAKVLLIGLFAIALLVFGGRAASIVAVGVLSAYLFIKAFSGIVTARFSYVQILGGALLALALTALFAGVVAVSGFGESIFSRLYLDDSAAIRMQNWQVFNYMTPGEILFGLSPQDIVQVMFRLGLHYPFETIEIPWIYMTMQFGLFGLAVLLVSLGSASVWFYRRTAAGGRLALLVFFVIASTYSSLAAKNCALVLLFAAVASVSGLAVQRPRAVAKPARPRQRVGATLKVST
ncbi:VpsF family polysaccharide biosynthesis protein [Cupriavidus basilensis]|uniref:VpsF family polysaccharide biosynthesis protein n=1 Tax=Cupriavidus basilensis TaxID=68895 RepID=A0ABT6B0B5_9BURK|nr:VpsF family polysaccharide biosynthesis protein [Cupriavidus basilensis]MDF3838315.1 VpsF family polysaccharide biosynthesis protein [Cupriavidus basilensis]